METVISFCITVYNQTELVKKCIDSIVSYKGNDIEIVVSDDNSSENIRELLYTYHDDRIKYYVNKTNLGHDRNILNALSKACGKYAFLLRTRDLIIPEAVPLLLEAAKANTASYITGEALNQDGDLKIQYSRDVFKQGNEALEANFKLYIHPSGSMYRLSDLDLQALRVFLDENEVPKNGFIVHNLIRLKLATSGDFRLIRQPVWIYTDSESAGDRAVNRSTNGISVYDPSLTEERYRYEVKWANQILEGEEYRRVFFMLTALYLDLITWGFKLTNSDKGAQYHYNYQKKAFSVSKQRRQFRTACESLCAETIGENPLYLDTINQVFLKNKTVSAWKYAVRKATYGTPLYNATARIYKKCFKGI